MASFVSSLLFFFIAVVGLTPAVSQSSEPAEPMCDHDWGEFNQGAVSVVEGDAGWLSCPLFAHPSVYNYSSTQSTGHNLVWYHTPQGQDLENPIKYSLRLSKERERLWLQPATSADAGLYICMLSNKSSCSKIAMRLTVLPREEVIRGNACKLPAIGATSQVVIPLQGGKMLQCPDLQEAAKMADGELTVSWYHQTPENTQCDPYPFWNTHRQQKGAGLQFHYMLKPYRGLYFCTVHYQKKGKTLNFTRSINVTAVYPINVPKEPTILQPAESQVFTVKQDTEVRLKCRGLFPYLESPWDIWWTVDGKTLDKLPDHHRFSRINRQESYDLGDRTEESVLVIKDFQSQDLNREFNCSVRNAKGFRTRRAQLKEEVSLPSVELGCGLGVTLVLMLLLFVVYHVFWLELLLLYRSWFGTDERYTDDKEYDVYISYARNSEEEQFVLSTLRQVLENELGYSVCIFDRDSLPGGNLSEALLLSMKRSRRLLFLLSPDFLVEKSFSLLECRLGLYLQHGHQASIVTVVYRSVSKLPCVEVAQLRQAADASITWRGSRSEAPRSRFWLRLRLALPVRPLALGRRLIDSTSSHSDLAAQAVQRVQRTQNQSQGANQSHRNRRDSANQSLRDRQAPPRARGRMRRWSTYREEALQHSRRCSGCAGFVGQVENRRAELIVETEMQEVSHDRTEIQSDHVPETQHPLAPDSNQDPHSVPDTDPDPDSDPDSDPEPSPVPDFTPKLDFGCTLPTCLQNNHGAKHKQQQLVIGSRTEGL